MVVVIGGQTMGGRGASANLARSPNEVDAGRRRDDVDRVAHTVVPTLPVAHPLSGTSYSAAELSEDDRTLYLLDQRGLPGVEEYHAIQDVHDAAEAIRAMVVRGAPAIGITAAYALVLAAATAPDDSAGYLARMDAAAVLLAATRPTAVNLAWALARLEPVARAVAGDAPEARVRALASAARDLHREDVAACHAMAEHGAALFPQGGTVLTHCNAGALATGGYGTALGLVRTAFAQGRIRGVLADETRPYLQGARLTAWELARDGVPVELVTDGMAGHLMRHGEIAAVVVGADRIAANGDVANKIGTYGLAVLASAHGIPMIVAAPWSTVDLSCADGGSIPIEHRSSDEVTHLAGVSIAPAGVRARHPAFDVTPARLVTAIVTERGVASPPSETSLASLASLALADPGAAG